MGPLERNAEAIAESGLPAALVVVAGRNLKLKQRLEARSWPIPTFIYGFVRNMPDLMSAADILVTKAGPGTITEALNAGLPIILYSRLPGQEEGNVTYVTAEGAGIWAPNLVRWWPRCNSGFTSLKPGIKQPSPAGVWLARNLPAKLPAC